MPNSRPGYTSVIQRSAEPSCGLATSRASTRAGGPSCSVIASSVLITLGAGLAVAVEAAGAGGALLGLLVVAGGLLPLGLVFPVRYEIAADQLHVRAGLLHWRISLDQIESVRRSRNLLSAPALSLDRLRIDYRRRTRSAFLLISPEDPIAFMQQLVRATPGLAFTGEAVARRPDAPSPSTS